MGAVEIYMFSLTLLILGVSLYLFISSFMVYKKNSKPTMTLGVNKTVAPSQSVSITCPTGRNISVDNFKISKDPRVVLACYDVDSATNTQSSTCDPMNNLYSSPSMFNPNTTYDMSNIVKTCVGKNTCSFNIPSTDSLKFCGGNACGGKIQIIGTYDCQ